MKKSILLAVVFLLIASVVFAGGGKQSGGANASQINLVMTSWYGGGTGRTMFGTLIEEFEKLHPDVNVEEKYATYNEYHAMLNSMIVANNAPDVIFLEEFLVNEWGEKGAVADLKPYYDEAGIDPKAFYVDGGIFTTGGRVWGVCNPMETLILYYNKKLLRDAGVTPPPESAANPWTWDQFVAAAKRTTKDSGGRTPNDSGFNYNDVVQWGTTNAGGYGGNWVYILPFVYTAGSSVANDTGTQTQITNADGARALQNIANLALVDKVAPTMAVSQGGAVASLETLLMNDQVAMFIANNGAITNFINEGYDVGLAQIPTMSKTGKGNNMVWGNGITLKPGASKVAFEFMLYMADFNNKINAAKTYNIGLSGIPQTRSVLEDSTRNAAWLEVFHPGMAKVTADILQNASRLGEQHTLKNFGQMVDRTLVPQFDRIWLGEQTAEQVLTPLNSSLQGMLQGIWQ